MNGGAPETGEAAAGPGAALAGGQPYFPTPLAIL